LTRQPLSSRWRYDLGHRKIYEFRSALGMPAEGPAPSSAVFAYGIVPGLARILTHPDVAAGRDELRLARVETVFASELDMRGELACEIDIRTAKDVVAVIACEDDRGARAVATIHLRRSDANEEGRGPSHPTSSVSYEEELHVDPARCVAFAAATWDLNPAYWDRELAEAADLGGLVAPPGLPLALAWATFEERAGRPSAAIDVYFHSAARPGERLHLRASGSSRDVTFEVAGTDGPVLSGNAVLGHGEAGL
jgi:acyl dehydratase